MAISIDETQDLIARSVLQSKSSLPSHKTLDPREVGMATGPRFRARSINRVRQQLDYLERSTDTDEWQKLDDDIYKFVHSRHKQLQGMINPLSHQFIFEVENQLLREANDYEIGNFLALVRLAADLDETRATFITASEKQCLHIFLRRLKQNTDENFDPESVKHFETLLKSGQPEILRSLTDLIRLVARAAHLPLLGNMHDTPVSGLILLLQVIDLSLLNEVGQKQNKDYFQISPLDVFLAARAVLSNRSVDNPTLPLLSDLVLRKNGLYHDDLQEWLKSLYARDTGEKTITLPADLREEVFHLKSGSYLALDMVAIGAERLFAARANNQIQKGLGTLSDALMFKVQKQDGHKDGQIQNLLLNFNTLLAGERRSAKRVHAERQRYDYLANIKKANSLVREIHAERTGEFAIPKISAAKHNLVEAEDATEKIIVAESQPLLPEWDSLVNQIRKKLSSKSLVLKELISQIGKARALDTCLLQGLTPGGSRAISRFIRLLQSQETRIVLGLNDKLWLELENALGTRHSSFWASLDSLLYVLYDFRHNLEQLNFRPSDRGLHEQNEAFDKTVLALIIQSIWLGRLDQDPLEQSNPFHGYCAFLQTCTQKLGSTSWENLDSSMRILMQLKKDWMPDIQNNLNQISHYFFKENLIVPSLSRGDMRIGWEKGCERGLMEEIRLAGKNETSTEEWAQLQILLPQTQIALNKLTARLGEIKAGLCQIRLQQIFAELA